MAAAIALALISKEAAMPGAVMSVTLVLYLIFLSLIKNKIKRMGTVPIFNRNRPHSF